MHLYWIKISTPTLFSCNGWRSRGKPDVTSRMSYEHSFSLYLKKKIQYINDIGLVCLFSAFFFSFWSHLLNVLTWGVDREGSMVQGSSNVASVEKLERFYIVSSEFTVIVFPTIAELLSKLTNIS